MISDVKNLKSRRFTALIVIFAVAVLLFSTASTAIFAESEQFTDTATLLEELTNFAAGAENTSVEEWINGSLSRSPELNEWYAIGISKLHPDADLTPYATALESYLQNNTVYSATTRQKYGLALIACGKSDSNFLSKLVDDTAGSQGIMSYVFALHLLTNGAPSEKFTPENIIPVLLELSCEGGGWALSGKSPDVDVTAMTVQALAPYYNGYDAVKTAVDTAILRLSAMQKEDGGFISYGKPNPESAAQVILALTSLDRDPLTDEAFIKNGRTALDAISNYRLSDGSFSHEQDGGYNLAATSQTFLALTALTDHGQSADRSPFFLFSEAPTVFPTLDYSIADTLSDKNNTESGNPSGDNSTNNGEDTVNPPKTQQGSYKLPVCIGVSAVALILCAVMFLKKRRAISDYLIVIVAAVALCLAVNFIDIYTPEQYYGQSVTKENPIGTVTVEIICDTDLTGRNDAVILKEITVEIEEGETVYDVLAQACRANGIVLDAMSGSPTGGVYVRGIDGLHEFAHGDLSGWTYTVNGEQIGIGCDKYTLSPNDKIVWIYSNTFGN